MTHFRRYIRCLCMCLTMTPLLAAASISDVEFEHLTIRNGLSNSQVNAIYKDSRGYMWFGTQSGLNRFDGYRFKNYFYKSTTKGSLPNNWISEIQEASGGRLLLRTPVGYTIYEPTMEVFDSDASTWMNHRHLKGNMDVAYIDRHKNWAVVANGIGLYYAKRNAGTDLFAFGKELPEGTITAITGYGRSLILTYNNGRLVCVLPLEHRVAWVSDYIPNHSKTPDYEGFSTYVSRFCNYWVTGNGKTWIYNQALHRWFDNVTDYLKAQNYAPIPEGNIIVKDIVEDHFGRLWMGTEHRGLIRIYHGDKSVQQFYYKPNDLLSLSDNTVQSLYLDPSGDLWVGTYKNGVSYYSPNTSRFATIRLGDVCTIVEDEQGRYWCGTNDNGIMLYNPKDGSIERFGSDRTGLGTDVVVSSARTSDGSLWFGTYNGGMARYHDGRWTTFRDNDGSGLNCDNVWSLCPLPDGRLAIGTLGGGVQIYNPASRSFETYRISNSKITSDYINGLSLTNDQRILAAHSRYYSIIDLKTHKVENFDTDVAHGSGCSPAINQAIQDSRGIIWLASASGAFAYDQHAHKLTYLNWMEGVTGMVSCSVVEDKQGFVWIVNDHGATRLKVKKGSEGWEYYSEFFNEYDGLQRRQLNFRSILLTDNGDVIIGGQDGINIIPPKQLVCKDSHERVIFSGLRLFDRDIAVGESYDGHVVLECSMNECHHLDLNHDENAFTVLLATNEVTLPSTSRFYYRLRGFSDKWQMTAPDQPQVTFTNLEAGKYTLEVRSVVRNGSISEELSTLEIHVHPPFWLTWWAYLIYLLLAAGVVWLVRRIVKRQQLVRQRLAHVREQAERNRQLDDLRLNFFTNVSHELRTPLTLIISPLDAMLKSEKDEQKRSRLSLIHRNAVRLFELVNQLLDFRKMDQQKQVLELSTGDVVAFTRDIVKGYHLLASREVTLSFLSDLDSLFMSFDPDKLRKILDNLLSNAFKYTPKGGSITVTITVKPKDQNGEDTLYIMVSDSGEGIPDEDKEHIFEPFFQASNHTSNPYGGSGVGLSLVSEFVKMHDGTVSVSDSMEGGSLFTVALPIRHDATLNRLQSPTSPLETDVEPEADETEPTQQTSDKGRIEVLLVDDADDFLMFMSEVLSERYKVITAHDGLEALERVREKQPDIILSDVMMPRMDGRELCRQLKDDPKYSAIPFIMLTARVADVQKVEGMQLGADDYLTKPFNTDILFLRIENLMKWRNAASEKVLVQPKLRQMEITSVDEQFMKSVTDYIEDHLSTDITVETMAADLGVSRVQLYRRVVSLTGSTPSEYLRNIRLRHAEQFLRDGQLTVSEVAYRVGFNNPRYFSKYFTEMYGVSPSQYCKNAQE